MEANRSWANVVSAGNALECGTPDNFIVDTTPKLEGGFWSSISSETDREKRNKVDQARMQLAFQLLAAILNKEAFGSDPGGTVHTEARTNFCGNDRGTMQASHSCWIPLTKQDQLPIKNIGTSQPCQDSHKTCPKLTGYAHSLPFFHFI